MPSRSSLSPPDAPSSSSSPRPVTPPAAAPSLGFFFLAPRLRRLRLRCGVPDPPPPGPSESAPSSRGVMAPEARCGDEKGTSGDDESASSIAIGAPRNEGSSRAEGGSGGRSLDRVRDEESADEEDTDDARPRPPAAPAAPPAAAPPCCANDAPVGVGGVDGERFLAPFALAAPPCAFLSGATGRFSPRTSLASSGGVPGSSSSSVSVLARRPRLFLTPAPTRRTLGPTSPPGCCLSRPHAQAASTRSATPNVRRTVLVPLASPSPRSGRTTPDLYSEARRVDEPGWCGERRFGVGMLRSSSRGSEGEVETGSAVEEEGPSRRRGSDGLAGSMVESSAMGDTGGGLRSLCRPTRQSTPWHGSRAGGSGASLSSASPSSCATSPSRSSPSPPSPARATSATCAKGTSGNRSRLMAKSSPSPLMAPPRGPAPEGAPMRPTNVAAGSCCRTAKSSGRSSTRSGCGCSSIMGEVGVEEEEEEEEGRGTTTSNTLTTGASKLIDQWYPGAPARKHTSEPSCIGWR